MKNHDRIRRIIETNMRRAKTTLAGMDFPGIDSPDAVRMVIELEGSDTSAAFELDPYWPKWTAPWWKVVILDEMGLGECLNDAVLSKLEESLNNHYINFFPLQASEIPTGCDPYRHILCHCALGTAFRILAKRNRSPWKKALWTREWLTRYRLPDGGYNCDEQAYSRESPHSSFLSTLPPLEAMLEIHGGLTGDEVAALAGGADYLISRKLCRSISKGGKIIDSNWLEPVFPRYYDYDILRGLSFLSRWALKTCSRLPLDAIEESVTVLAGRLDALGRMPVRKNAWAGTGTLYYQDDLWRNGGEAEMFSLMQKCLMTSPSPWLTSEWYETVAMLDQLDKQKLLGED
ncbi:MAG: hypothetical protein PHQ23_06455 [Candidatus Wallbacteria bacterium]|nr:hypothetical protein [Candidatus Wallbacteria bacterium]